MIECRGRMVECTGMVEYRCCKVGKEEEVLGERVAGASG